MRADFSMPGAREKDLQARYGDLLTLADLATVLRYPSLHAIRKARVRGRLPLVVTQMPHRRGWYATARAVAQFLDEFDRTKTAIP